MSSTGPHDTDSPPPVDPVQQGPKTTEIRVTDGIALNDELIASDGLQEKAVRVTTDRWSAAGDAVDGTVVSATQGVPSHGEHLTGETAKILMEHFNERGGRWTGVRLRPQHDPADRELLSSEPDQDPLGIQVTRPETDFWKTLDHAGHAVTSSADPAALAAALWDAIERKRSRAHPQIVLALNVIRTPGYVLRDVVAAFRARYAERAAAVGFREAWLVGPSAAFVHRLDEN
jgi:hypothetical protein